MMLRMQKSLNQRIELFLYKRGFEATQVREMMRNQVYVGFGTSVLALTAAPQWGAAYVCGAARATFNFFSLARLIQRLVFLPQGAVTALLLSFYGRLLLSGFVLFALIAWAKVDPTALLAGISTIFLTVLTWGIGFFVKHS